MRETLRQCWICSKGKKATKTKQKNIPQFSKAFFHLVESYMNP